MQKSFAFFSNPLVGVIGTVASIVGLVLAVVFYFRAQLNRELVYTVDGWQNVLSLGNEESDLQLLYKGKPLAEPQITARLFAFWNRGNASIKSENILKPIEIALAPPVRILSVSIKKKSRDIVALDVSKDEEFLSRGRIPVTWNILERNDGVSLQIIYAGPPNIEIKMIGVIEGQAELQDLWPGVPGRDSPLFRPPFGF